MELDLSKYPHDEIETLIWEFIPFGVIKQVLPPSKVILRATPNSGERFTTRAELSYKPPEYNVPA